MRHGFSALAVVLLTSVFACESEPVPPLRVGILNWPPYELFILARDLGHYDDRIEIVDVRSPVEAMRAYRTGTIDVIALTLDYALETLQRDSTNRAILIIDFSYGADVILAHPPIASISDLKGRRVGIEASTLGALMVLRALEGATLTPDDVEIVPVDVPDHVTAYATGQVDAIVTFEPARSQILRLGALTIFSSRDIPGEIVDLLMVRTDVGTNRAEEIQMLVDGWFHARDYLERQPDSALALLAPYEGLTVSELRDAFDGVILPDRATSHRILAGEDTALIEAWRGNARFMSDRGLLARAVDPAALLWPRFVTRPP